MTIADRSAPGTKIAARTQTSLAIARLRSDIINGRLKPSEKLRIRALAERHQLGPSPLREALSRLVTDGFVDAEDQRGFRVSAVSREDLIDLTECRIGIECLALTASLKYCNFAWESEVLAAFHRLSRCPTPSVTDNVPPADNSWAQCHRDFHRSLIAACRSEWLLYFCDRLYEQSERYRVLAFMSKQRPDRNALQEHERIMRAAVARDINALCMLTSQHFRETAQIILEVSELRSDGTLTGRSLQNMG